MENIVRFSTFVSDQHPNVLMKLVTFSDNDIVHTKLDLKLANLLSDEPAKIVSLYFLRIHQQEIMLVTDLVVFCQHLTSDSQFLIAIQKNVQKIRSKVCSSVLIIREFSRFVNWFILKTETRSKFFGKLQNMKLRTRKMN